MRFVSVFSRNKKIYIPFFILLLLVAFIIGGMTFSNTLFLDGFTAEIATLVFRTDSRYAKGYTHEKFASIKIGMTEKEVLLILGEPLKRWPPYPVDIPSKKKYIGFAYSESPASTHYRLRQIYFSNGVVTEIHHYLYFD